MATDLDALNARVAGVADALPAAQRAALVARERDGASHAAIAEAVGVAVPDVADLLIDARFAVRAGLRGDGAPPLVTADCLAVRRVLCRRQDGEPVPAPDAAAARVHVDGCDPCRVARRGLREASIAGRAWAATAGDAPAPTPDPAAGATVPPGPAPEPSPAPAASTARRRTVAVVAAVLALAGAGAGVAAIASSGDGAPRPAGAPTAAPVFTVEPGGDDVVPPPGDQFCPPGEIRC